MAKIFGWLKSIRNRCLPSQEAESELFQHLRELSPQSILELGISDLQRTQKMLEFAAKSADSEIRYVGVDWFDARSESNDEFQLKNVHQLLKGSGRIRLLPGGAFSVLARHANSISNVDLVILGSNQEPDELEKSWFFLPRMIHENSLFLVESQSEDDEGEIVTELVPLGKEEVFRRCGQNVSHIRRAA